MVTVKNRSDKVFDVNVVRYGDPLEIYTNSEGEVIFKKYSAIGEISENASQVADIMCRLAGCPVIIFDRDHVVSVSGTPKKEFLERRGSAALEDLMESRKQFVAQSGSENFHPVEGVDRTALACQPILTSGDVTGAVAFLTTDQTKAASDLQISLISAAAQFLGRQIEA